LSFSSINDDDCPDLLLEKMFVLYSSSTFVLLR
jgi:hypothetical protein